MPLTLRVKHPLSVCIGVQQWEQVRLLQPVDCHIITMTRLRGGVSFWIITHVNFGSKQSFTILATVRHTKWILRRSSVTRVGGDLMQAVAMPGSILMKTNPQRHISYDLNGISYLVYWDGHLPIQTSSSGNGGHDVSVSRNDSNSLQ